jgi:uncharacterized protein YuzE
MKVRIDKAADALYIDLDNTQVTVESEEVQPGIILDFNTEGAVVGIEVLGVSKRNTSAFHHIQLETVEA